MERTISSSLGVICHAGIYKKPERPGREPEEFNLKPITESSDYWKPELSLEIGTYPFQHWNSPIFVYLYQFTQQVEAVFKWCVARGCHMTRTQRQTYY